MEDLEDDEDHEDSMKAMALGVGAVVVVTELMRVHGNAKEVATILVSALAFHIDGFAEAEVREQLKDISIRYLNRTVRQRETH